MIMSHTPNQQSDVLLGEPLGDPCYADAHFVEISAAEDIQSRHLPFPLRNELTEVSSSDIKVTIYRNYAGEPIDEEERDARAADPNEQKFVQVGIKWGAVGAQSDVDLGQLHPDELYAIARTLSRAIKGAVERGILPAPTPRVAER